MVIEPSLTDEHKEKRKIFANWVRNHFRKEDTMRFLFSDEKMIDMNGIKGRIKRHKKFPQKVMVWLGVCSKGVSPIVIFEKGTLDHDRYIRQVLPVALRYGNQVFGSQWTFQQDGAMPHTHRETQEWCATNFPSFIDKDHWPPNSPDLNPLDYCIWDELGRNINWGKISTKKTMIDQIKLAVKKIRPEVVLESCASWTNRLYRMSQKNGEYLRD